MPEATDNETDIQSMGYRISNGPVVRFARSDPKLPNDLTDVVELPRVYGAPLLFAIARDPHTLFAYWIIDWSSIFENTAPVDRQVHLRVRRGVFIHQASQLGAQPAVRRHAGSRARALSVAVSQAVRRRASRHRARGRRRHLGQRHRDRLLHPDGGGAVFLLHRRCARLVQRVTRS